MKAKTATDALLTRLMDGAVAMRNVAFVVESQLVGAGMLEATTAIKQQVVVRLRHEADQNDAAATAAGTNGGSP